MPSSSWHFLRLPVSSTSKNTTQIFILRIKTKKEKKRNQKRKAGTRTCSRASPISILPGTECGWDYRDYEFSQRILLWQRSVPLWQKIVFLFHAIEVFLGHSFHCREELVLEVWTIVGAIYISSQPDPTQHPSGWSSFLPRPHSSARWMLLINVNLKTKNCYEVGSSSGLGFRNNPWNKLPSPLSPIKVPIGQSWSYEWHPLEFAGNVEKETLSSYSTVDADWNHFMAISLLC